MERLTKVLSKATYMVNPDQVQLIDNGYSGEAINRLALFENLYEELVNSQKQVLAEMEQLRLADKTKSVKFRELMAKKLTNSHFLYLFKQVGLE